MARETHRFIVNASWLIKLRWFAVLGQMLTVTAVLFLFSIQIQMLWAIWSVIGITAFSNLILSLWFSRWSTNPQRGTLPWDVILGLVLAMDLGSLTVLLFASGGPNNPFMLFYFVNLSLGGVILKRNWAWGLYLLSVLCFALLLYDYHQIDPLDYGVAMWPIRHTGRASVQQLGLMVAFATCGSVIVYFMTRLTDELQQQQLDLERAQQLQARSEKLQALGTLAAGAAHELSTPLATIAVVARDVEKAFEEHPPAFPGGDEVVQDVSLIRSQLERCRKILDRMSSHAGESANEAFEDITMRELAEHVLEELPENEHVTLQLSDSIADQTIRVPVDDLGQALRGLVQNAIDAGPGTVALKIIRNRQGWIWEVSDLGPGMSPDVLKRISEPFFTTKAPGKGMGLGLFLAENVVGRLGGNVRIESQPGRGTRVIVELPERPLNRMEDPQTPPPKQN